MPRGKRWIKRDSCPILLKAIKMEESDTAINSTPLVSANLLGHHPHHIFAKFFPHSIGCERPICSSSPILEPCRRRANPFDTTVPQVLVANAPLFLPKERTRNPVNPPVFPRSNFSWYTSYRNASSIYYTLFFIPSRRSAALIRYSCVSPDRSHPATRPATAPAWNATSPRTGFQFDFWEGKEI